MSSINTHQVSSVDLRKLLKLFSYTHYKSKDTDKRTETIEDICIQLFSKDYPDPIVITNENGELSNSYPSKIVIPEADDFTPCISRSNTLEEDTTSKTKSTTFNDYASSNRLRKLDANKLKDLLCKARVARCRARFPIPVILYKNKYICRSATLSSGAEIYGRSVIDYYTYNNDNKNNGCRTEYVKTKDDDDEFVEAMVEESPPLPRSLTIGDASQLFSKVRNQDIKLLKYFSVKHICDLMLEKKKVKFGMNVTSSEKADKENRYSDFNIISLPYPGCEFFREYRDNSYCAEGLIYNWNQNFVDAMLDLPNTEGLSKMLSVNFKEYRSWDVVKLTQNYMKLLLHFIRESDSSILIHCISGWDRTPLFMSLLRLTLWADGEIHKSLSATEITYLTVAYDWFLFGHNLNDRLVKGEEIMFFCFQFLKFITNEQFSINYELPKCENESDIHKRKISVDSYSNGEDFVIENIPSNFGGSLTSLNSNCSLPNTEPPMFYSVYPDLKSEDLFSSSISPPDIDKLKITSNENLSNSVFYVGNNSTQSASLSSQDEMISTLTSSDQLTSSRQKLSPSGNCSYQANSFYPSTKPVEIPNANKNSCNLSSSLCRSDSWQIVSDAGSIRENIALHHFSSPDSLKSLRKDILDNSNSPLYSSSTNFSVTPEDRLPKSNKRKKKLLEVRSLFNSAYTSLNFNYNGCRFTNLVDHFVGPFYSTRETPE